jgi:hypothetical protein
MKATKLLILGTIIVLFLVPQVVFAQAFGEYGRIVGGVGNSSLGQKAPGVSSQIINGRGAVEGIGDLGGRHVPRALVVASKQAALYPRQDEESEKMAELSQGDTLLPVGQSNDWYMVKTQKGLVGWIKSADVRAEAGKKQ